MVDKKAKDFSHVEKWLVKNAKDFSHVEKWLVKKAKVNFKIYGVTDRQQIITIHTLSKISISKGNRAMKFGQLIEKNVRNLFLQNSYRKLGREASSRPLFVFYKIFI